MMFSLFGKRARDPHGLRLFEAHLGGRGQDAGIVCGCPSRRAVLRPFSRARGPLGRVGSTTSDSAIGKGDETSQPRRESGVRGVGSY